MKVISLQAENIKKIKAIRIDVPDGQHLVKIVGQNAQGKSSLLDAMWLALRGADAAKTNPEVISRGKKKGEAKLNLGELLVTRRFTEKDDYLSVERADGVKVSSPQKLLDSLIGQISFDPLEFSNYDPKKQKDILLKISGINLDEFDKKIEEAYAERAAENKSAEKAKAAFSVAKNPNRTESVDVADILSEISELNNKQNLYAEKKREYSRLADQENKLHDDLVRIQDTVKKLLKDAEAIQKQIEEAESKLDALGTEITESEDLAGSIAMFTETLKNATEINKEHDETVKYHELQKAYQVAKEKAEAAETTLAQAREAKDEAVRTANMPISGLGFGDKGITFNNIPFEQSSSAERLKVSVAIAMALNPTIRVLRITDGSLLDDASMKFLEDLATEKDYQIWMEVVSSDTKAGIYIEDGEIKS